MIRARCGILDERSAQGRRRLRVAVFGTGGAGGYFGAQLAQAGHDVTFVARGEHLRAIRAHGLRLDTPDGEQVIDRCQATDDPAQIGPVDVVLVGVKSWQVPAAAAAIRPLIGTDTIVVPLQNGVDAPDQLAAVLGPEHVLGGLCGTFSWVTAPGRIRSIGASNFIRFGALNGQRSDTAERLRDAFVDAGVKAEVPADIRKALWDKFLLVSSFGGMGALTRAPIGIIRTQPQTRALLQECMREVQAVGRAHGIAQAETVVADTIALVDQLAPASTTSLQRDIADGKPSELEAWNGAVVRLARERDVAVPRHSFIYDCLLPLEQRARGLLTFPS
jgi:2-dehydropantoate 2-reductase